MRCGPACSLWQLAQEEAWTGLLGLAAARLAFQSWGACRFVPGWHFIQATSKDSRALVVLNLARVSAKAASFFPSQPV